MNGRKMVVGLVAVGVVVVGWYLFRPERLVVNKTVNEEFAGAAVASTGSRAGMGSGTGTDAMTAPTLLASGAFHNGSHEAAGTASIYQTPDGKRVLRFTNFHTSNGPDVQVYLGMAPDAFDDATVTKAGFYHVAALKGNIGDQNYDLPADLDLSKYRSVTIWCRRFGKNFGTAPLTLQNS